MDTRIHGWPMCAKCNKPVDTLKTEDYAGRSLAVTAACHGKEQTVLIPHVLFEDLMEGETLNADGFAFTPEVEDGGTEVFTPESL
ncbi:MAG: hypothetical protein COA62_15800 [Rhodobiaceae bacterium]|nr:MAG: hypothetical protein COA62_15800 [Rhodobiaceae bacterium]